MLFRFITNHPWYTLLAIMVTAFAVGAYVGSQRIYETPDGIRTEGAYERPLYQE